MRSKTVIRIIHVILTADWTGALGLIWGYGRSRVYLSNRVKCSFDGMLVLRSTIDLRIVVLKGDGMGRKYFVEWLIPIKNEDDSRTLFACTGEHRWTRCDCYCDWLALVSIDLLHQLHWWRYRVPLVPESPASHKEWQRLWPIGN